MSTHQVLVRRITILPHPNADALELGQVDDFVVVVQKGLYKSGDLIAYIPEQSILPDALVAEMGLEGRLGSGNRVKPVKLRGQLSQGLCYPAREGWVEGQDVGLELGVEKWTPEVPKVLAGNVYHLGEEFTVAFDIENVKKFPGVLIEGEEVKMTEKVHGTFVQFILVPRAMLSPSPDKLPPGWFLRRPIGDIAVDLLGMCVAPGPDFGSAVFGLTEREVCEKAWGLFSQSKWLFAVSSKGVGAKGNVLKAEDPANAGNLYLKAAETLDMQARMVAVFGDNECLVTVCGELYGTGVQDLHYGAKDAPEFRIFDIYLGTRGRGRYLNSAELEAACAALDLKHVPVLYQGPFSRAKMLELTDGKETISGQSKHLREGIVVGPVNERRDSQAGRVKFKSVSADYLTRKGGTEHN